ncbi:hypothetical protein ABLN87_00495 [Ruegeria sp. SCPT10]|uniref:hypothetical protein n=1 Tax=Ruegeria sp. SCP10 TaxID=3141377 RepID=UPI00333CB449
MNKIAFVLALGLLSIPAISVSQTFTETYECKFGPGLVNKPTPESLAFSVDEYGRSAYIHEIEIPDIDTRPGPARVKRDSIRNLSIAWVGQDYVYSATGRSYASNESRIDAIDLLTQEFTVFLDRRTLKATARSTSHSAYLPRDGFARGKCKQIPTPSS